MNSKSSKRKQTSDPRHEEEKASEENKRAVKSKSSSTSVDVTWIDDERMDYRLISWPGANLGLRLRPVKIRFSYQPRLIAYRVAVEGLHLPRLQIPFDKPNLHTISEFIAQTYLCQSKWFVDSIPVKDLVRMIVAYVHSLEFAMVYLSSQSAYTKVALTLLHIGMNVTDRAERKELIAFLACEKNDLVKNSLNLSKEKRLSTDVTEDWDLTSEVDTELRTMMDRLLSEVSDPSYRLIFDEFYGNDLSADTYRLLRNILFGSGIFKIEDFRAPFVRFLVNSGIASAGTLSSEKMKDGDQTMTRLFITVFELSDVNAFVELYNSFYQFGLHEAVCNELESMFTTEADSEYGFILHWKLNGKRCDLQYSLLRFIESGGDKRISIPPKISGLASDLLQEWNASERNLYTGKYAIADREDAEYGCHAAETITTSTSVENAKDP